MERKTNQRNWSRENEVLMEYDKWFYQIPYLNFPSDWFIKITPPSGGAVVRFRVVKGNAEVSIYLDCYQNLGYFNEPYWEIYPFGHDVQRVVLLATEGLLQAISRSIEEQNDPSLLDYNDEDF